MSQESKSQKQEREKEFEKPESLENRSEPNQLNESGVDEIDAKYQSFEQFDIVEESSDNHYSKVVGDDSSVRPFPPVNNPSKNWVNTIQKEWKVLKKDLPQGIYVRIYEDRMDLLSAVIVGAAETPYHDGLYSFDAYFPANYPQVPPNVTYRSYGMRINPNLYADGTVCLSLLGTWEGNGCEAWNSTSSTMLQVLVSLQALVLNSKPYYNEPNIDYTDKQSLEYNKDAFLLSCKTMLTTMRTPPKYFEDLVRGHFRRHGHRILVACIAYLGSTEIGFPVDSALVSDRVKVGKGYIKCSQRFRTDLMSLFGHLLVEFSSEGVDIDGFDEIQDYLNTLEVKDRSSSWFKKCLGCIRP